MASTEGTAGSVVSGVAPALNLVPFVGGLLSTAATVGGGLLQKDAAAKQAAQAANERQQANALKPRLLDENYWKAFHSAKMASLSNMAGYEDYINNLAKNSANQMRAIQESSPNGAATLAAISALHGSQNEALNKIGVTNSAYKQGMEKEVRNDLWNLGLKKDEYYGQNEEKKNLMYQDASAKETAAMANRNTGFNTILGGLSSTATSLTKNLGDNQNNTAFNNWYNNYIGNQSLGSITPMGQNSISSVGDSGLGMTFSPNPY